MKNKNRDSWHLSTKLNHSLKTPPRADNQATVAPIYQAVKFVVTPELAFHDQYIYTRISNPTLRQLETSLAEIQGREDCIVYASGMAAITGAILGVLKAGDHMITFRELYRPARMFVRDLPRFGMESTVMKLKDLSELEKNIRPGQTKLIHFESPSNPNLEIADIEKILAVAKKHNVLVSMDGTFAGIHQHRNYAVDLIIHSLTKFGSGHGDVLAGSVSGKKELIEQVRVMSYSLGATLDPHAAFLVERGMKTYLLRYEKQTNNAHIMAEYLAKHPKIKKVYYPGLAEHRGSELAKKQMKDMGAMVSFEIDPSVGTSEQFSHKLKLIQYAVSLGSTETLIAPTHFFFGNDLNETDKSEMGINQHSLRLSVGLEDTRDLIQDLESALSSSV